MRRKILHQSTKLIILTRLSFLNISVRTNIREVGLVLTSINRRSSLSRRRFLKQYMDWAMLANIHGNTIRKHNIERSKPCDPLGSVSCCITGGDDGDDVSSIVLEDVIGGLRIVLLFSGAG